MTPETKPAPLTDAELDAIEAHAKAHHAVEHRWTEMPAYLIGAEKTLALVAEVRRSRAAREARTAAFCKALEAMFKDEWYRAGDDGAFRVDGHFSWDTIAVLFEVHVVEIEREAGA